MIEKAIEALHEARLDIENWGSLASPEDQEHYDLAGNLARIYRDIAELEELNAFLNRPISTMAE